MEEQRWWRELWNATGKRGHVGQRHAFLVDEKSSTILFNESWIIPRFIERLQTTELQKCADYFKTLIRKLLRATVNKSVPY